MGGVGGRDSAYPRLTAVSEVREERAAATANAPAAPMSFPLYTHTYNIL